MHLARTIDTIVSMLELTHKWRFLLAKQFLTVFRRWGGSEKKNMVELTVAKGLVVL